MKNVDEDRSIHNGHAELEIVINRPALQIWKPFLDFSFWVTSHNIMNVHGEPGTVGSITRVSSKTIEEQNVPLAHYHYCKIVKLIPERQYLLKTYSEEGGSYGLELTAFDDIRFVPVDGKTRVVFNYFGEMKGESIAKDPTAINLDGSIVGMRKNLENLKQIIESR